MHCLGRELTRGSFSWRPSENIWWSWRVRSLFLWFFLPFTLLSLMIFVQFLFKIDGIFSWMLRVKKISVHDPIGTEESKKGNKALYGSKVWADCLWRISICSDHKFLEWMSLWNLNIFYSLQLLFIRFYIEKALVVSNLQTLYVLLLDY